MSGLRARTGTNTLLGLLAALGLTAALAMPALAVTQVDLHEQHVGTDSSQFGEDPDCGEFGNTGSGVVWHFILNQLQAGTAAGTLTAQFASAADQVDTGEPVGQGQTQHFYVLTPTDDILEAAWAMVDDQGDGEPSLVLSHVCHQAGGESPEESPEESVEASVEESPEESVEASVEESPESSPSEGELGGTPTASPAPVPDTALGAASQLPAAAMSLVLLASLVALLYARLARQR